MRNQDTFSLCPAIPHRTDAGAVTRVLRIFAFAAFTAVGAQLAVRLPFTPVPVTMQTLFVVLAGITLGPRDGFYAMVSYLAVGLAGAPVFAGFTFGPLIFAGPTGGYLIAFPAAALLAGYLVSFLGKGRLAVFSASIAGSALILLMGGLHFSLLARLPAATAAQLAVLPFAAGEAFKGCVAAVVAGKRG